MAQTAVNGLRVAEIAVVIATKSLFVCYCFYQYRDEQFYLRVLRLFLLLLLLVLLCGDDGDDDGGGGGG